NAVPRRAVVAATSLSFQLKAQRVVSTHGADVQIARHEDVVVARTKHGQTAPEERSELKSDWKILRGRQRVEAAHASKPDVAYTPNRVHARDAMRLISIHEHGARVERESVFRDEHRQSRRSLVVARDRRTEQAEATGRSDAHDAADV